MSNTICVDCGQKQALPRVGTQPCLCCGGRTVTLREDYDLDRPETVFVCSPLRGDYQTNLANAQKICRRLATQGIVPIAPHVYFPAFLDDNKPDERRIGIRMGITLMQACNEVWFYGNTISPGMREELLIASRMRKPIRHKTL